MAQAKNQQKTGTKGKKNSKAENSRSMGPAEDEIPAFLRGEVLVICTFMVAVLLFLSNFRICGAVGNFVRGLQLGLFGIVGYAFPILLFAGTSFYLSNSGNRKAVLKLCAAAGAVLAFCGLAQLFVGGRPAEGASVLSFYQTSSVNGSGGGLIGGLLSFGLSAVVGTIGAFLVLAVVLILCGVFITEKSVVSAVKNGSDRAYQYAKEDAKRRKEEREELLEERRRLREENVVRGVDLTSTKIGIPAEAETLLRTEKEASGKQAPETDLAVGAASGAAFDSAAAAASGAAFDSAAAAASGADSDSAAPAASGAVSDSAAPAASVAGSDSTQMVSAEKGQSGSTSAADVFSGRINLPPEYAKDEVPFEEDPVRAVAAQKAGSGQTIFASREIKTLAEMEVMDQDAAGISEAAEDAALEAEAADSRLTGKSADSEAILAASTLGRAAISYTSASPSAINDRAARLEQRLQKEEEERMRQSRVPVPDAYEGADRFADSAQERLEDQNAREDQEFDQAFEEQYQAEEETEPLFTGQPDEPESQDLPVQTKKASGYNYDSIFVPEEPKRIVTANGKIIETETELLHKKLEKRKEEAAVESSDAVVTVPIPKEPPRKPYAFPPTELLKKGSRSASSFSENEYKETAIKLQQTLKNFGVGVTVTDISCGPSVTRYELHPEQGVKVSRIVGLADDIKLSLAAAEIRIEAPIPGKSAVGIEVPNKENSIVYLRDLLESDNFTNSKGSLAFAVGKDIGGQVVVTDIAKMPHLLIAGATGSGKSVCINTLIMSIIYKYDPEDVKMIMVDPKVVELSVYNGIPHLLIPVVTDPKKASGALNWAVAEMTDRYKKFAECNVRDLKGYNQKIQTISDIDDPDKPKKLPQIIIIVDELADLMMVAPGEVEDAICRLAQLARAAGIHLVIATQRPSVNVITGLIKANVPSRIAFSVSSGVDSRTIIDMNGAEKLLGKGDMLFYPSGVPKPQRVQGAFVSDQEVFEVVEFLKEQGVQAAYNPDVETLMASPALDTGNGTSSGRDDYFAQAGKFIIEKDKASIGMLQRVFKIGFNRAARIMDQLADAGVVGEEEGTKPRKVLMTLEEFQQIMNG